MRQYFLPLLLTLLGISQVCAFLLHNDRLRTITLASTFAPLPEVFGSQFGIEPISTLITLRFYSSDGEETVIYPGLEQSGTITKEWGYLTRYCAYFAAVGWAPLIAEKTRDSILRYGACPATDGSPGPYTRLYNIQKPVKRFAFELQSRRSPGAHIGTYEIVCPDTATPGGNT